MNYRFLRFPGGLEKAVTLSYDDGTIHDKRLIEIADRNGIKVTLNINSEFMGKDDYHLGVRELKGFLEGGHEIAVHGARHIAPGVSSLTDGIRDVLECRQGLERSFGRIIRGMAYPDSGITILTNGTTKDEIKNYLKYLSIAYARSLAGDNDLFRMPEDFYEWIPTAHHNNPRLYEYIDKFINSDFSTSRAGRSPLLFYLWGHSYEFDRNGNWELFEEACERLGCKDSVWYATNIELHDYAMAYRALQFNLDNTLCRNPTSTRVWFEADRKGYVVEPGETVEL